MQGISDEVKESVSKAGTGWILTHATCRTVPIGSVARYILLAVLVWRCVKMGRLASESSIAFVLMQPNGHQHGMGDFFIFFPESLFSGQTCKVSSIHLDHLGFFGKRSIRVASCDERPCHIPVSWVCASTIQCFFGVRAVDLK